MLDKYIVKKYTTKRGKSNTIRKKSNTHKRLRNRSLNINHLNANSIRERIITLHTN